MNKLRRSNFFFFGHWGNTEFRREKKTALILYFLPRNNRVAQKNATLGIGWGYYSKKYATTLILIH